MSETVTVSPPQYMVHITRPGGKTGLDVKGTPREASPDTLATLAKEYGVDWKDIAQATFETTDHKKIEMQLRDEGYGINIDGHWWMRPGLEVKIPVGPDGKPTSVVNPTPPSWPKWAKWIGIAALGAGALWAWDSFAGEEKPAGRRLRSRDDDDEPDDPDDEDED